VKDGSDERHDQVQPISDQGPFPTIGSKAKGREYASQMPVTAKRYFIKRNRQSRARGSRQGRGHGGAGSRPKHHLTCNQAPAYIRGPGPLIWGDPIFFFLLEPEQLEEHCNRYCPHNTKQAGSRGFTSTWEGPEPG
jgi:hypothetical protein